MKIKSIFYWRYILIFLAFIVILFAYLYPTSTILGFSSEFLPDIAYVLAPAVATICSFFLALGYCCNSDKHFFSFTMTTIGLGLFTIGEIIFLYNLIQGVNTFPSIADLFFIIAPLVISLGISQEISLSKVYLDKKYIYVSAISSSLLITVLSFLVFDVNVDLLSNLVSIGYVVGDGLMLLVAIYGIVLFRVYQGGKFSYIWFTISLAAFLYMLADVSYLVLLESYEAGNFATYFTIDMIWIISYLLFALSFAYVHDILRQAVERLPINKSNNDQ